MGRVTALQKPNGSVRGIMVSDVFRTLVARTMAQQLSPAIEGGTSPALSTWAGTECIAHAIQALTDLDPTATVVSIDGIGAFDVVSRRAMLEGLQMVDGATQFAVRFAILWVRVFLLLREESKGIPCCLLSFPSASIQLFRRCRPSSKMGSASSPSWMMSTSCVHPRGSTRYVGSCSMHSLLILRSGSTTLRPRFGIVAASFLEALRCCRQWPESTTLTPSSGDAIPHCAMRSKACGFCALRWVTRSSSVLSWRLCLRRTISCWRRSSPSKISSVLGYSFCFVAQCSAPFFPLGRGPRLWGTSGSCAPSWQELAAGVRSGQLRWDEDMEPGLPRHGWQRRATEHVHGLLVEGTIRPRLSLTEQALFRSQGGPLAGVPFMFFSTLRLSRMDSSLLCASPSAPLASSPPRVSAGSLARRQGCWVVEATLWKHRRSGVSRDLDLLPLQHVDARRLEVVADGLPLFHGAQIAVDTTVVAHGKTALLCAKPARGKSAFIQSSHGHMDELDWSFSPVKWEANGLQRRTLSSVNWRGQSSTKNLPPSASARNSLGSGGGA